MAADEGLRRPGQSLDDLGRSAPHVEIDNAAGDVVEDEDGVRRAAFDRRRDGESHLDQRAGKQQTVAPNRRRKPRVRVGTLNPASLAR